MLKALRNKNTKKNIFTFLAVVIVVSFVVSGVLISQDDQDSSAALGVIGKRPISIQQYLDSYRAVERQASFVFGEKLNEMKDRINFKGEAWDRLLLLDHAKKRNIRATDAEVVQWISSQKAFHSKDKFDDKLYALYIERALRSTPRAFEEEIRQMLTLVKLNETVRADAGLTDEKLKELYKAERSEKDLLYCLLPWENQKDQVTVTEESIQAIYEIVKHQKKTPEQVKMNYLFTPKGQAQDETVWKETGFFAKGDTVPDLGSSAKIVEESFKLAAGAESKWIETDLGRYKVKLLEKKPESVPTLEEMREEIKKDYVRPQATDLAVKRLQGLKERMKAEGFEAVLKAEGLEVTSHPKYHSGMYPAGIYPSENLKTAASALNEGEISDAFETPRGGMIIQVTKAHPFDEAKFESEKEEFKKANAAKLQDSAMNDLMEKLRKDLTLNLDRMKEIFPEEPQN